MFIIWLPGKRELGHIVKHSDHLEKNEMSYLAEDAAHVLATGYITWVIKVFHDSVKAGRYLIIFFHITASELRILLTKAQRLLGLKRRLVVQTLWMTAPPPGLEEQQQHGEKETRDDGRLQITDLLGHGAQSLSSGCGKSKQTVCDIIAKMCERTMHMLHQHQRQSKTGLALNVSSPQEFGSVSVLIRCPAVPGSRACAQRYAVRIKRTYTASHLSVSWPDLQSLRNHSVCRKVEKEKVKLIQTLWTL